MSLKPIILAPVSSEHFSEEAIRRAAYLAARFTGELTLLYVIEERVLKMINRTAEYALTTEELEWTEEQVLHEIRGRAQGMLFERAALLAAAEGIQIERWEIVQGEYAQVLRDYCRRQRIDLIVLSHDRALHLGHQLLEEDLPPLWIERGKRKEIRKILAVASSLAPDSAERLPPVALEFARRLGAELHLRYVLDPLGARSPAELQRELRRFENYCAKELPRLEHRTSWETLRGPVERLALTLVRGLPADLLIVNRRMQLGAPALFRRDPRRRLLTATPCPLLFI